MSFNPQGFLIDKYNFSRRVVDHRVPYDLNHAINKPYFSLPWLQATKKRMVGRLVQNFSLYYSMYAVFIGFGVIVVDGLIREQTHEPGFKSIAFSPKKQYGERFIWNSGNKDTDQGRWNHNFFCWTSDPNCGRDFD